MAAEEVRDPQRSIPRAYIGGIVTLVLLAAGVMICAGGVGDWTQLANINDPLPQAMKRVVGQDSGWLHMLLWLGLFGLVASFHGIIIGYSRQMFALARAGYLPHVLARIHPRFHTPHVAILAGGVVGVAAIFSDGLVSVAGQTLTATIVTMSVFGAIVMYIVSMASLFRLRRTQPDLPRPFRAPGYPWVPGVRARVRGGLSVHDGVLQPAGGALVRRHDGRGAGLVRRRARHARGPAPQRLRTCPPWRRTRT